MPVARNPAPAAIRRDMARVRAQRALMDLEQARLVVRALEEGVSQDTVADLLGLSQPTVSRLAARAREHPEALRPNVSEVLNRVVADDLDNADLQRRLLRLRMSFADPNIAPKSDWAALRRAVNSGLVARPVAEKVVEDTARRFVARVTDSMDLEDQTVMQSDVAEMIEETTRRMLASFV